VRGGEWKVRGEEGRVRGGGEGGSCTHPCVEGGEMVCGGASEDIVECPLSRTVSHYQRGATRWWIEN